MGSKTIPTTLRQFSKYIFCVPQKKEGHTGLEQHFGVSSSFHGLKVDYIDFLKLKFSTFVQSTLNYFFFFLNKYTINLYMIKL